MDIVGIARVGMDEQMKRNEMFHVVRTEKLGDRKEAKGEGLFVVFTLSSASRIRSRFAHFAILSVRPAYLPN